MESAAVPAWLVGTAVNSIGAANDINKLAIGLETVMDTP
jgi:hypothetical protein